MSLYQDYLKGACYWHSYIKNIIKIMKDKHSTNKLAKEVKKADCSKIEVHNKLELDQAIKARRFYRLAF